jgi:large subunit ribosomal protein L31
MKSDIHPKYYPEAKVKCVCGNHWTVGSTLPEVNVSICSKCHPFYTGTEKIVDTRGRVDRYKKQLEKSAATQKAAVIKKPRSKSK